MFHQFHQYRHPVNDHCCEMTKLASCKFLKLFMCFAAANAHMHNIGCSSIQFDDNNSKIWREHESHCGGEHQSPINIDSSKAVRTNYPKFCFHNYDLIFPERLENNGHTVELKIEEQGLHAELPFITGGGLVDRYNFVQLHFHWGKQLFGSEHTINRKGFAGELHIVHYNTKYGSFKDAIPFEDGLAVLGILIELTDRDNIAFRHLELFENIIDPSTNSDLLHFSVPLVDLLPRNTESFYRYNGSLTSGDCNEDVIWTVFDTPIAISERQLAKFRLLHDENGNPLNENVRPTQHLHDRVVSYRPAKPKFLKPIVLFPNIFTSYPNVFTPFPSVFSTFYAPAPHYYYRWRRMHNFYLK